MNGRAAQAGFTLVELLGGLAVTAILVLPLVDLLHTGADSARTARADLALNNDMRFALDYIAARAAAAPKGSIVGGEAKAPGSWLAPFTYTRAGTDLVETDTSVKPERTSVIASNVEWFELTAPEVVDGRPVLGIALTLSADGSTVAPTRTVRVQEVP